MVALPRLTPTGDGTQSGITRVGANTSAEALQVNNGDTSYVSSGVDLGGSLFVLLSDVPTDFGSMNTATVSAVVRLNGARNDDNIQLYAQIFAADETTPLSNELLVTDWTTGSTYTTDTTSLSGLTGTRAQWNGARLRLRWVYTKSKSSDGIALRVTQAYVDGDYAVAAAPPPKAHELVDDFTNGFDAAKWTRHSEADVYVDAATNEVVLNTLPVYPWLASAVKRSILDSTWTAELTQRAKVDVGWSAASIVKVEAVVSTNFVEFVVEDSGYLGFRLRVNSVDDTPSMPIPNPEPTHYRIRCDASRNIYWEYWDGATWIVGRGPVQAPADWDLDNVSCLVQSGYWQDTDSGPHPSRFGSVNIEPTAPVDLVPADTAHGHTADAAGVWSGLENNRLNHWAQSMEGDLAADWINRNWDSTPSTAEATSDAYDGKTALRIISTTSTAGTECQRYAPGVPATQGETLELSAWVKHDQPESRNFLIGASYYVADGWVGGFYPASISVEPGAWTKVSWTCVPDVTCEEIAIRVGYYSGVLGDSVVYDQVYVGPPQAAPTVHEIAPADVSHGHTVDSSSVTQTAAGPFGPTRYGETSGSPVSGTSTTVTLDSPAVAGELIFVGVTVNKDAGSVPTCTSDVGAAPTRVGAGYVSANVSGAAFTKIAEGGEQTFTLSWSLTNIAMAQAACYPGGTVGTPVEANNGISATNTLSIGAVSVGADGGYVISYMGPDTGADWIKLVGSDGPGVTGVTRRDWTVWYDGTSEDVACALGDAELGANATSDTVVWSLPGTRTDQMWGINVPVTSGAVTPPPTPTPTLDYVMAGGTTSTSTRIFAETTNGTNTRVRWSTSADMTGATTTASVAPDSRGIARLDLTGLPSNSRVYYKVDSWDGSAWVEVGGGDLRTYPAAGDVASYGFAMAGCWHHVGSSSSRAPNPQTFARIQARAPLFNDFLGDKHYRDTNTSNEADFHASYDTCFTESPNYVALVKTTSEEDIWSDHDSAGNASHAGSTGLSSGASEAVRRNRFPHSPHPTGFTKGLHRAKTIGRVLHIWLDTRSFRSAPGNADDVNKVMLGAEQEQWFKDTILGSDAPLILVRTPEPWPPGGNQDDHWGSYRTEQQRLLTWLDANLGARKLHFLTSDAHMVAVDDGASWTTVTVTNQPTYSGRGIGTWCAGPIGNVSSTKGAPWSVNGGASTTYTNTTHTVAGGANADHSEQYGWVDITDDGATITATYTARRSDSDATIVTHSISVATVHDLTPNDAVHGETVDATALTQQHALAPQDAAHAISADAASLAQTHSLAPADTLHATGADGVLVDGTHFATPADTLHATSADTAGLTQAHSLTPATATHATTTDTASLAQVHALAPAEALHGHEVESTSSDQLAYLSPADATHGSTVDAAGLTQTHSLTPAEVAHGSTADSASLAQVHALAPAETLHSHAVESTSSDQLAYLGPTEVLHGSSADATSLTQTHGLTPADVSHDSTADGSGLTQQHALAPDEALHGHAVESTSSDQLAYLGPADVSHGSSADATAVAQQHALTPADVSHSSAADAAGLTQVHALAPADAGHATSATETSLNTLAWLDPSPTDHPSSADSTSLTQQHALTPADVAHATSADATVLDQVHALVPADAAHGHAVESTGMTGEGTVYPADALHATGADATSLAQQHALAPESVDHATSIDTAGLTQVHGLAPADVTHGHTVEATSSSALSFAQPADALHPSTVDGGGLTQEHALAPNDTRHETAADEAALAQSHALSPTDASHAATVEATSLLLTLLLVPSDALHATSLTATGLTQTHGLGPADVSHSHAVDTSLLGQLHLLAPTEALHAHDVGEGSAYEGMLRLHPRRHVVVEAANRTDIVETSSRVAIIAPHVRVADA